MPTVSLSELLNSTNQLGYTGSRGSFDGVTDQAVLISNATPSDNTVSGALQVAGGVGISGNVYVGQELYVTGNILPTSNNTVNIGSPTQRFGTVYLSANSVDIGGAVISTSNQGDLSFATTTGTIDLNANSVSFLSNVAQGTVGQTGYTGSRGTDGVIGVDGYTGSIGYTGSTSEATTVTVSPVFKGALLAVNGTMNLPAATYTTVTTLGTVVYDTDNFASVSNRLTIPAGVSKVKLSATMIGASQTEQFILIIIKNGQTTYTSAHDGDTGGADGVVAITPVIPVVAGDYFQLQAYSTLARTTSATPETSWFAIEVVEGSMLDTTSVIRTTGYTGSAGADGQAGYTGSRGTDGVVGVDGYTGSAGAAGDVGYTGSVGDAGVIGYTGSGGTVSVTTGNTVPASPAAGDMWYRTTNNVLYQYTDVGTASYWIDISGPSYNFGISQSIQTAIAESTGVTPSLEYLVVAGGGSGSASASVVGTGGGGAGGYLAGTWSVEAGTTYVITVGAGGAEAPGGTDQGNSGTNSSFGDVAVTYGGGRGGFWQGTAANGGSGGGGGGGNTGPNPIIPGRGVYPGSTYISAARQGYDGGIGTGEIGSGPASGGGGGGAGGAGGNSASTTVQAAGGLGVYNTITGANVYYAKGGTGGVSSLGSAAPSYLAGGANTGSGGSGGSAHAGQTPGLAGGSGVVVFRYPNSYGDFLAIVGNPTVTNADGYKIYVFTSSGSITI